MKTECCSKKSRKTVLLAWGLLALVVVFLAYLTERFGGPTPKLPNPPTAVGVATHAAAPRAPTSATASASAAVITQEYSSSSINALVAGAVPSAKAITTFPGPYGLTGVVIKDSDGVTIGWTNKTHEYFILGSVLTPSAKNLTVLAITKLKQDMAKDKGLSTELNSPTSSTAATTSASMMSSASVATPSVTPTASNAVPSTTSYTQTIGGLVEPNIQKALQVLALSSVEKGYGPVQITAFIDPNCIFCHDFYESLTSIPDWKSKYSVTFVPIAIVNSTSMGKAEAILSSSSALTNNEKLFNDKTHEGGVAPIHNKSLANKVKINTGKFLALTKVLHLKNSAPLIIYNTRVYQYNLSTAFLKKLYN